MPPARARTDAAPPPRTARKSAPGRPAGPDSAEVSGPQRALLKLGLVRDIDLALHLPLRYEDETRITPIAEGREGDVVQVQGVVRANRTAQGARRHLLVRLADDSGELQLRFLNFYPSQQKALAVGTQVRARGELRIGLFGPELVHPQFKAVAADAPLPDTLTPVYPASAALPQAYLRKAIATALQHAPLAEVLPPEVLPPGLPSLADALRLLHHPPPGVPLAALDERSHPAWQRLKFEELLAQQLSQQQARRQRAAMRAPGLVASPGGLPERLLAALPFTLTAAQRRVADEIAHDLARERPMNRLLQGDVGSGKTVVAALAASITIAAGWQCALMAPTELLAEQHFRKLVQWLEPLGVQVAWLTGSRKGKRRTQQLERIASGDAGLVVGTHAVIQDDVVFRRLALAIVDEQHRFGVAQRLALRGKRPADPQALGSAAPASGANPGPAVSASARTDADSATETLEETPGRSQGSAGPRPSFLDPLGGPDAQRQVWGRSQVSSTPSEGPTRSGRSGDAIEPHLLMMSATPIPRTLAMSYFADLDVSTIDELPPGRTPVLTKVFAEHRRDEIIRRIGDEVAQGRQVYWVCPLIEESEAVDLRNATETHATLAAALPGRQVALLHGRMPPAEKAATMALFTGGQAQVLVSTTVIEVGVDVPNASLMVIEHAERFGLSQLHQLRGRVGRGAVASVCVLLYTPPLSRAGKARLQAMAHSNDGFEIARLDLEIRGPGEFMGARQSGDSLLRFADLAHDTPLLQAAREAAERLWAEHPAAAAAQLERWLAARLEYLKA